MQGVTDQGRAHVREEIGPPWRIAPFPEDIGDQEGPPGLFGQVAPEETDIGGDDRCPPSEVLPSWLEVVGQHTQGQHQIRRGIVTARLRDPAQQDRQDVLFVTEQNLFLVPEVAEEGPLCDAGGGRDLIDRGGRVALGGEQVESCVAQPRPRALRPSHHGGSLTLLCQQLTSRMLAVMAEPDITQTVLVTGPTRGLGRALVDRLARHPARPALVLAGRDPVALAEVAARARQHGCVVRTVVVDLADLGSVGAASEELRAAVSDGSCGAPTAYVANAGLQVSNRRQRSTQGHELTFAVNVLAQHALLRGLRPTLAPGATVVLLGSSTHRGKRASFGLTPDPVWRDPAALAVADDGPEGASGEAGGRAYADSKLALVTLSHAWARELAGTARVVVYDPGLMPGTGLARDMPAYKRVVWRYVMPVMRVLPGAASPRTSARHLAALALGETFGDLHDGYVWLDRSQRPADNTFDRSRQDRLWQVLNELTSASVD